MYNVYTEHEKPNDNNAQYCIIAFDVQQSHMRATDNDASITRDRSAREDTKRLCAGVESPEIILIYRVLTRIAARMQICVLSAGILDRNSIILILGHLVKNTRSLVTFNIAQLF